MGRKRKPKKARRQVISLSLKPSTIALMDEALSYSSSRSRFAERAILKSFNEVENYETFSNRRLMAILIGRFQTINRGNLAEGSWEMGNEIHDLMVLLSNEMKGTQR